MWKSLSVVQITYFFFFFAILVWSHISLFLSNSYKSHFLIDHHCKNMSETFDSVVFVRIG